MPQESDNAEPIVIKKYANRRLYNTDSSTYVTLEDLADMVKAGNDFVVYDAKTSEDITRSVLTQIIFEQEAKGQNLLPVRFLQQLIRFYGNNMQQFVPSYLEFSLESLAREQEKFQDQITKTWGVAPFDAMQEQVRRNMAMFEQALGAFNPFAGDAAGAKPDKQDEQRSERSGEDLDALKRQLSEMQAQLNELAKK